MLMRGSIAVTGSARKRIPVSTIQLKVVTGMNNCVIISNAFSKGVRVGEIFRDKEEGGKKDKC